MESIKDSEEDNSHARVMPEGGDNEAQTAEVQRSNTDNEDPLDKCPPDFRWARKHAEANMVKNLDVRNAISKDLNDEDMYCP